MFFFLSVSDYYIDFDPQQKGQKKKAPNLRVLLDSENNHMNTPKSNHQNDTKKHKKKHQNDTSEYMHEARALFNLSLNNCVQDTIPYPELELPESRVHTSKDTMESIESIFDAEIINQTKESIPEHVMGSPKSISARFFSSSSLNENNGIKLRESSIVRERRCMLLHWVLTFVL